MGDLTVLCEMDHSRFHSHLQKQGQAFQLVAEVMQDFIYQKDKNPSGGFVPTGYGDLDRVLGGGLHRSDLILLGSRSGDGKSALALNIARNAALKGNSVVIFTLEMSKQQLFERLVAVDSGVKLTNIRRGELHDEDWDEIMLSLGVIQDLPLHISDEMASVDFIGNQLQQLIDESKKLDLVIVDYIGLIKPDKYASRQYAEHAAVRSLKLLARKFNVPVLALCQLPRGIASKQDKVPQLAHFTNAQDQDADVVLLLYREEVFNPETHRVNCVDILVPKNSNEATGEATLYFRKESLLFTDLLVKIEDE